MAYEEVEVYCSCILYMASSLSNLKSGSTRIKLIVVTSPAVIAATGRDDKSIESKTILGGIETGPEITLLFTKYKDSGMLLIRIGNCVRVL